MTTTVTVPPLDAPTALRLLREVVAERPDYRYRRDETVYFARGKPACLVGHVLARHGLGPEDVSEVAEAAALVAEGLCLPDAGAILAVAQETQDIGAPWRRALRDAELVAAERGVSA